MLENARKARRFEAKINKNCLQIKYACVPVCFSVPGTTILWFKLRVKKCLKLLPHSKGRGSET